MGVGLRVLSERDIEKIHDAALQVLERTGAIIESDEAAGLLCGAGARIDEAQRVHIPPQLVARAIECAPSAVTIYDRLGNVAMELGGSRSYFGAHVNCPQTLDPLSGQQRDMTLADLEKATRVVDALPNMAYVTLVDAVAGVSPKYSDVACFATVLASTSKPIGFDVLSLETGRMIVEMAAAAVGGSDALRARPFLIPGDSPVSPLYHPADPLENILFFVRHGLPCVYNPMPQGGLTAPTTTAGVLVMTVAEILTGLVVTQLASPGTPFICGGVPSIFDMRDATFVYGSPELFLMCSALTDIVHYYELPAFGTAGMTNAKTVDSQAATDVALATLMAVLSGSNLVHDVGIINAAAHSLPLVVLADEVIGMVRHIEMGIDVSAESLALDVIDRVGPRGTFIAEEHTREHFLNCWYPRIFDHTPPNARSSKGHIDESIRQHIESILATHRPAQLPPQARELIDSFAVRWKVIEEG